MTDSRINYIMGDAELASIMEGHSQGRKTAAWAALGRKWGFEYASAKPIHGLGPQHFSAIPSDPGVREAIYRERERLRGQSILDSQQRQE